ncbi:stimulator of interferon [Triplophysa rosa]|uniref:Stimulator of interferon genes protein n=2 Tax=Triplophysa rosa TaxID=992332 RepID=A0A9W7WJA4_TRIRA|nr:stimulator of interferon [Triplophysa rosa]
MREDNLVPRQRSRLSVVCAVVLGILALGFSFLLDSDRFTERLGLIALCITLETSLYSVCLFAEEWIFHLKQRYRGQIRRIVEACFNGHVLLGMLLIYLLLKLGGVSFSYEQLSTISLTCAVYMFSKSLSVLALAPVEISEICEVRKMNVAHGLAWSFFFGYLRFVLPDLNEKVRNNATRMRLSSHRLHILLPLNAAAPNKPEDEDDHVVFHENLPELQLNRAGVRQRSYKNSVYKITGRNNETYYCALEYATPLQTLYQMSQDRNAGFGEKERKEQVLLFYRTLSQILENDPDCRNLFRLVLINDEHTGEAHYLSREIIQHLTQQEGEIHMNPIQENLVHPLPEKGVMRDVHGAAAEDQMSSNPTLMFSLPGSLRSEPVETTDDYGQ